MNKNIENGHNYIHALNIAFTTWISTKLKIASNV